MDKLKRFGLLIIFFLLIIASVIGSSALYQAEKEWWSNLLLNFAASLLVTILVISILSIRRYYENKKQRDLLEYEKCLNKYDENFVIGVSQFRNAKRSNSGYWMHSWFGYFFEKYETFLLVCQSDYKENQFVAKEIQEINDRYNLEKKQIDELFSQAVKDEKELGMISKDKVEKMETYIIKNAREEQRIDILGE